MKAQIARKSDLGRHLKQKDRQVIPQEQWLTPGSMLRAARVRQGLTTDHVCKELGLIPSYLNALEGDEHEILRAPAYVRGYIRRYCSMLDIRQEEVLACYEATQQKKVGQDNIAAVGSSKSEIPLPAFGKPALRKIFLNKLKISNWTFPLGLCAFAILGVLIVSATSSSRLVAQEVVPASEAALTGAILEILLEQQSWIEVTDARADILVADLKPAGSRLQFSGTPPFQIKLDNATGVNVSYQQQPIHLNVNSSDNTVQMTVGG